MDACRHGAKYKREDGLVIIDPGKCVGCRNCIEACPYNAIYFNKDLNIAQKCTGCAHLLDAGWKETRCSDNCPTMCIRILDEDEAKDLIAEAEVYKPEFGTNPRVYYLHLPKKFVAGTVFDPVADEVYIGADCKLTGAGQTFNVKSDHFGDFWFNDIPEGKYRLEISVGGKVKVIDDIDATELDVNVGDIAI
jgi:ferredoxin